MTLLVDDDEGWGGPVRVELSAAAAAAAAVVVLLLLAAVSVCHPGSPACRAQLQSVYCWPHSDRL